ncbi:MAG: TrbI/VirB10 family protein [Hydrogenophaga sp.]|nr:TrbI/VirB10 family protein [Hydrogenophaga sp.]
MGLSKESLIAPEEPKPGIPLKKSTLAVLGVAVLALGVASSIMFTSGPQQPADLLQAQKDAPASQVIGKPQSIDEEIAKVEALPSPIPASVQRPDSSAGLYEKPLASLEGNKVTSVVTANRGPTEEAQQAVIDAERESQVRMAKAMVVDFDDKAEGGAVASLAGATPAGMMVTGARELLGADQRGRAPSETVSPAINAALDQLRGAQAVPAGGKSWMKEYAGEIEQKTGGKVLRGYQPPSNLILHQGKVIPAVLGRQINSDLPGRITATTTVDIYDSLGKGQLLIPKGSTLDGQYDAEVKVGQSRILFGFERLILPDGTSFDLPPAPGSDLRGAAGISGDVNNHFFKMFASSLFIAFLADKTTPPQNVTNIGGGGGTTKTAAGEVLVDVSKSILDRNKVIPPTITVPQGERINVEVVSDMVFARSYSKR